MQNPSQDLKMAVEKVGWLNQMLGPDFWQQIQESLRMVAPPSPPAAKEAVRRPGGGPPKSPPVDLYLTPIEVVLYMMAPGITAPEQIRLGLAGPTGLVVELYVPGVSPAGLALQQERFSGYCARTVPLPAPITPAGAEVRYEDGLLEIHLRRLDPGGSGGEVSLLRVPTT